MDHDPATHGFATTQWSIVLRAGKPRAAEARAALEVLCGRYWYPLYVYARRRARDAHEARDLTQEFFVRLLEKGALAAASPERGKFRSFLLASLKNFLANEWDRARAQKRGGGKAVLSLDWDQGETRYRTEPRDDLSPERAFDREWALALLDHVLVRLQNDYTAAGKARLFEALKDVLLGGSQAGRYDELAAGLGMTEDAVRQAAHRLRKRYRELLRAEVAQTVEDPADVDAEIRGLFAALGA